MKDATVYIKLNQETEVDTKQVCLSDVGTVYCAEAALQQELGKITILTFSEQGQLTRVESVLKVIEKIHKQHPSLTVQNLGETDFLVSYQKANKPSVIWEYMKTFCVCCIIFIGAAFTIMTFNTDVNVSDVFRHIYEMFTGMPQTSGSILEISYSIGLPIGVLIFYNHFSKKKRREDPTPIHVELRNYEEQVNKAVIQDASREGRSIDVH